MTNQEHHEILRGGRSVWNTWREEHPEIRPNLDRIDVSGADFRGCDLSNLDLRWAKLHGANLSKTSFIESNLIDTDLSSADLSGSLLWNVSLSRANLQGAHLVDAGLGGAVLDGADLSGAVLDGADLIEAHLIGTKLQRASLQRADLSRAIAWTAEFAEVDLTNGKLIRADLKDAKLQHANLQGADLSGAMLQNTDFSDAMLMGAKLERAALIDTILDRANLDGCLIYGISAWNLRLNETQHRNLVLTQSDRKEESLITVDDLEVAQFIYLILNNSKLRRVIDTVTSKAVLILGRFTPERKIVLDELRKVLREKNYLPILFDFEKPDSQDLTETIATLAHMSRFIIADITDAKSIPQELAIIVPTLPSVPVQPLIASGQHEFAMFDFFRRFPWVLPVYVYESLEGLLASLDEKVIVPAEEMVVAQRDRGRPR